MIGTQPIASRNGLNPEWDVDLFPNPTDGQLSLCFSEIREQRLSIRVYNALGEQIMTRQTSTMNKATEPIDLSTFTDGIYTILVDDGQHVVTKRIVLAKATGLRP